MPRITTPKFITLSSWILTYALAIISGWTASKIGIPIPWMLGPLVCTGILCTLNLPLKAPGLGRNIGQCFLGVAIGLYFTPLAVSELTRDIPYIALACLLSTVLLVFGTWMLWRFFHIPLQTAFFASALGGAPEMTLLAERHQQRADLVAAAHSLRLLLILLVIPALFQAWGHPGFIESTANQMPVASSGIVKLLFLSSLGVAVFQLLKLPNAFLLGPLFVTATLTACEIVWTSWPREFSLIGQLLVGVGLGIRFNREFILHAKNLVTGITLYTFIACVVSTIFALAITQISELDFQSLILSTTPGGMAEMGITAKVFHLNVPAVTVFHVMRMVFVIMTTELFFKYMLGRLKKKYDFLG